MLITVKRLFLWIFLFFFRDEKFRLKNVVFFEFSENMLLLSFQAYLCTN